MISPRRRNTRQQGSLSQEQAECMAGVLAILQCDEQALQRTAKHCKALQKWTSR
jgi:hypothetical protein